MSRPDTRQPRGPFRADQLRPGDPYELSNGHPIECLPTGGRGSRANLSGGLALGTDPDVASAGIDTGFSPEPGTLRAPDLAVGDIPDAPGWVAGAPPLALEYADTGQDEDDLARKIADLLAAGTRYVWVVRLTGPRRVEVHRPQTAPAVAYPGESLTAPGVLRNPVPVDALYDADAAQAAALRNLLQRQGYESLDALRGEALAEGKAEGMAQGMAEGKAEGELGALRTALIDVLEGRGLAIDPPQRAHIAGCTDPAALRRWLRAALTAADAASALAS